MIKEWIAEIFVPKHGTRGEKGEIATGYPVTRDLILTARHPLFPPDPGRDENRPIDLRWRHPAVLDKGWQAAGGIVWDSERWDLALLQFQLPQGISPCGSFLSERRPADDMEWVSVGFPRVGGKRDGVREPFHMKGTVFSMLETDRTFAIDATAGPPLEDDWKGASGSPVVVNWRILGIIVSVPEKLGAQRLRAVPMWRVLQEDPTFCEKVGYRARQARRDSVIRNVEQTLRPSFNALDALAKQLPGASDELKSKSSDEKAHYLAQRLLDAEVDEVIAACQAAHRALAGVDAMAIADAVQIILPAVYDHGVVETVRGARGETAPALLTLPAFYPTVAEIIMAGVDGRETLFCPLEREDDFPKGKLNLPEPPEGGWDEDGRRAQKDLEKHLTRKFCWEQADPLSDAVDDFMVHRFPSRGPAGVERTQEQKIRAAAREIQYRAEKAGRTHYLIFTQPKDSQDQARLEQTVRRIRKRYPGLMCLSLTPDFAVEDADNLCFRPLLDLLPKKQRESS